MGGLIKLPEVIGGFMNLRIVLPFAFVGGVILGGIGTWLYGRNQSRQPAKDQTSYLQDQDIIKKLHEETDDYFEET